MLGFFITGNGPQFVDPSVKGQDGRGTAQEGTAPFAGQIFFNPEAGTIGSLQRRMFSGPWVFNMDFTLAKRAQLTERQSIELRMEAFNVFNNASFDVGDEAAGSTRFNINQATFGTITSTFFDARRIQFGLYYRF